MRRTRWRNLWRFGGATVVAFLTGCAGFSPDNGFDAVRSSVSERTGQQTQWSRTDADSQQALAAARMLLAAPLTPETAVQVALLNNRGLQATYFDLGIAEADLVQAGRLRNPGFSFTRLRRADELEI